jgi:hypothetical protein
MKNSKYVENWFCKLLPTGTYMLTFDVTDRGMDYHMYCETMFLFNDDDNEGVQEIPKFLPENSDCMYLSSSHVEKDQITFFFTPFYLDWIKNGESKIIISKS